MYSSFRRLHQVDLIFIFSPVVFTGDLIRQQSLNDVFNKHHSTKMVEVTPSYTLILSNRRNGKRASINLF